MDELTRIGSHVPMYPPSRQRVTPEFSEGVQVADFVPITPTLKTLKIGEIASFPAEQRTSVLAIIYRLRKQYVRQKWDVEVLNEKEGNDEYEFKVKRIS